MHLSKKSVLLFVTLLLLIFLAYKLVKINDREDKITGMIVTEAFDSKLQNAMNNPIEDLSSPLKKDGIISSLPEGTTITTASGSTISNIAGSYNLLIMSGSLVGGVIVSSANNNAIPAFNPLTGDMIIYNMDLGDTVTIDYTGEPAYRAKLSEGIEAEIQTKNKVRFTAHGKDSMLKIKPTEEPSYEFNNGLLEYESQKVLEQINTTRTNDANVDKDYETGFKCLTLAANANYNYKDKVEPERSFSIKNLNKQDYKVCIKKTIYDEYQLVNQRYALIDLVRDSLKLKAKVQYSKKEKLVYESLDSRNDAEIETSLGTTKLLLTNKAPTSKTVSRTYIGSHVITETLQGTEVIRYHEYSKTKHPELINIYSTNFKNNQPDITINNNLLIQQGKNKFTALTQENKDCLDQLQGLLSYEEGDAFYETC